MVCKYCAETQHDQCPAVIRGIGQLCDCQHGHKQVLLKRRFGPPGFVPPAPSLDGEVVRSG